MRAVVIALVLALVAPTASAAPRSQRTAFALSGVGTGVSGALFLSAFLVRDGIEDVHMPLFYAGLGSSIVTPSLGQFYAGTYVTPGLVIRTAAVGLATYAAVKYTHTTRCKTTVEYTECTEIVGDAIPWLGVAAIAFVGGAALDFKDIPGSVARWNRRHGIILTPTFVPASGGGSLLLVGQF